jgi:hypothetical protein
VVTHRFLIVAKQIGHVRHGDAPLQKDTGERVSESVGSGRLVERTCQFKDFRQPPSPDVGNRLEAVGAGDDEWPVAVPLGAHS